MRPLTSIPFLPSVLGGTTSQTIPGFLQRMALEKGTMVAIRYKARGHWVSLSWAEYGALVRRMAGVMGNRGFQPGERLAIILPTCVEWEILDKAALTLGLVVVGLDARLPWQTLAGLLLDIQPAGVVVADEATARRVDGMEHLNSRFLLCREGGSGLPRDFVSWETLAREMERGEVGEPPRPLSGQTPAAHFLTSGTTGAPKGIVYNQAQLILAAKSILKALGTVTAQDTTLAWLPMSSPFQRVLNLAALLAGATLCFWEDPSRLRQALAEVRPTVLIGVPRVYEKIYLGVLEHVGRLPWGQRELMKALLGMALRAAPRSSEEQGRRTRLERMWLGLARRVFRGVLEGLGGRMRFMVSGSAPCREDVLLFFHVLGIPLLEAYGVSECIVPLSMNCPNDYKIGTVGRPLAGNEVRLEDDGEVEVAGEGVFKGYEGRWVQTNLTSGRFLSTGDLGTLDSQGYLTLRGRKGDLIKTSTGRKVDPVAIEQRLLRETGADQGMVVGHGRSALVAILCFDTQKVRTTHFLKDLREGLSQANEGMASYEQVRGCLVLSRPFSFEMGELTGNFKLRRFEIERIHGPDLEAMLGRLGSAGVGISLVPAPGPATAGQDRI